MTRSIAGDRRGEAGHSQQADPLSGQHPSPLRSSGRHARLRRGRRDHRHPRGQSRTSTRTSCWRRRSRTLMPDRLSQFPWATTGPGPAPIETFTDRHAISDGQRTIQIFHVQGLNHNQNMAIVYLPQERIVINADLWSPPAMGAAPRQCRSEPDLAVQQHPASEARCCDARADPRQPRSARRFRADRGSRWRPSRPKRAAAPRAAASNRKTREVIAGGAS